MKPLPWGSRPHPARGEEPARQPGQRGLGSRGHPRVVHGARERKGTDIRFAPHEGQDAPAREPVKASICPAHYSGRIPAAWWFWRRLAGYEKAMMTVTQQRPAQPRPSRSPSTPPDSRGARSLVATALLSVFYAAVVLFAEAGYIHEGGWWLIGGAVLPVGAAWLLWDHHERTQ
jgi:hypothetical protein